MKVTFFFLLVFLSNYSFGGESSWSEGKCDASKNIFEGATRDFYNRGAGKAWKNKQGDWLDAKLTPQGNKPFTKVSIKSKKKYDLVNIDGTILTKYWQRKIIPNHGFFIRRLKGDKPIFFSKDNNNSKLSPHLIIKTKLKTYNLTAIADTELSLSTYQCINSNELLNSYHNLILRFDLSHIKEEIIEANLQLTLAKDPLPSSLNIYAVNIEDNLYFKEFGLTDNYVNDESLKHDKHVFYYENFDDDQWRDKWGVSYWGSSYRITNKNEYENFIPLNKSALEITIEKGKHSGMSAHYPLSNLSGYTSQKIKSAYLRYNLQLGSNWSLSTSGKLPGFAGIYGDESYKAGWGGRKSDGTNGWSTRGMITPTLSLENTLAARTPIGSYIYHADMKYTYGDERAWNLDDISVLKNNTWYSIEQYVHMNTSGNNDGILKAWVNGVLVYSQENIRFTDNPHIGIESVWLDIYHGGSATAPKNLTLFIDDLVIASKYIGTRIHQK
jgi:hypothetical protein